MPHLTPITKTEARKLHAAGTERIGVTVTRYPEGLPGTGKTAAEWAEAGFPTFEKLHEDSAAWQHRGDGRVFYFRQVPDAPADLTGADGVIVTFIRDDKYAHLFRALCSCGSWHSTGTTTADTAVLWAQRHLDEKHAAPSAPLRTFEVEVRRTITTTVTVQATDEDAALADVNRHDFPLSPQAEWDGMKDWQMTVYDESGAELLSVER